MHFQLFFKFKKNSKKNIFRFCMSILYFILFEYFGKEIKPKNANSDEKGIFLTFLNFLFFSCKVPNESSGAALYSPGNRFCMRLQFWGSFEVFPLPHNLQFLQSVIFWKQVVRWGRELDSWKEQAIPRRLLPHCYAKRLNGSKNQQCEKWENGDYP